MTQPAACVRHSFHRPGQGHHRHRPVCSSARLRMDTWVVATSGHRESCSLNTHLRPVRGHTLSLLLGTYTEVPWLGRVVTTFILWRNRQAPVPSGRTSRYG